MTACFWFSCENYYYFAFHILAREIGVSRSRLVSLALQNYLRHREHEKILEKLNSVYGEPDAAEKRVLRQMKTKFRSANKERW